MRLLWWRKPKITEKGDIVVRCNNCNFPAAADPSLFPEGKQYIIRKCEACGTRHRMMPCKGDPKHDNW